MSPSLPPDARLGRCQIKTQLSAGNMGEVYLALDRELDRTVAIKILPMALASDHQRLQRFIQEAKVASALNHPHIVTIHEIGTTGVSISSRLSSSTETYCTSALVGFKAQAAGALNHPNILVIFHIGTHNGAPYIVSELLEGETLRERMAGAALPQRKAIDYALQIAHGLAAAHAKGIVHRDLKPENLFVTNDGRVKILDFGLAKLTGTSDGTQSQTEIPTRRVDTDPGVVMGTMGYMSPEQLRGKTADHRSDIFSFGAILYEMLSGKRAFRGESMAETMSAILREDPPDLCETNKTVSPALERVVHHCLEKNPDERFHSARDLAFAIESLSGAATSSGQTMTEVTTATERRETAGMSRLFGNALAWIVASLFLLALVTALGLALFYIRQPSPESLVTRLSINLPKGTNAAKVYAPVLALSPDGRRLVFEATDTAGKRQLWLRPLDSFTTQPLAGTDGAHYPFWSPDGRYVAFFADNKLKKLDTGTSVVETICQTVLGLGGDWNRNGIILFSDGTVLSRVNAAGGNPEVVTDLDPAPGETSHIFPSFLPDGKHYVFRIFGRERDGIYVGSLDSRDRKLLIPLSRDSANSTRVGFALPGYILYAINRTTLLGQVFDPVRLEVQGEPFRVAENVIVTGAGSARFTASTNGVLAFIQGGDGDTVQLTWCDRSGKRLSQAGPAAPWTVFGLSPDERFAAVIRNEPSNYDSLWLLDLVQRATSRFVTDGDNFDPVWSPDGQQLAFSSVRNAPPNLYLKPLTGNVPEERLLESRSMCFTSSWSPDGKFLIYWTQDPQRGWDLWLLPLSGDRKPQPLLQTKANERYGKVSPDGNWLAYVSDESGSNEVYVTQFPQPAHSWRISTSGGTQPYWRGDGKELFFVSGNKLMAVSVGSGTEFQVGTPQPLFEIEGTNYAPSKDGQRFLVSVVTEKAPAPPINVVLNWTAQLKK